MEVFETFESFRREKKCFENGWMILKMGVGMCCLCYLELFTFTPILCLANVFHVFYMSIIYIFFTWLFFSWIRKVNLKKEGCDLGMFLLFSLRNVWNILYMISFSDNYFSWIRKLNPKKQRLWVIFFLFSLWNVLNTIHICLLSVAILFLG